MKSILIILLSLIAFGASAQTKPIVATKSSGNCFKDWYTLFKERGANPVPDGTQDIIITLRSSDYSECFVGKVDVIGGKIVAPLQIQKVDGTFEGFDKKVMAAYQNSEGSLKEELREINNGMSASVTLADGEIIRLFFPKYLAAKPKANKKAPPVSSMK